MVEAKMQEKLIAKINDLDQLVKSDNSRPQVYGQARDTIKELVNLFNSYEMTKLDGMDGPDYTAHLLVHLVDDNDTVNAKFLFLRVPEVIKKRSQSFMKVWETVRALSQNDFGGALTLLREPFPESTAEGASPLKEKINVLREILVWHLSYHTVPELISDAYSTIEFAKVKQMLGNPVNFDDIIRTTGLLQSAAPDQQGFVSVNPRQASYESFALDQQRVKKVTQVVQFLERQRYNVTEQAQQEIIAENERNDKKIQGKLK